MEQRSRHSGYIHQAPGAHTEDLPLAFQRFYKEAEERDGIIQKDIMSSHAPHIQPSTYRSPQTQIATGTQKITSLDIPFWRLVGFQMKFMLAACVSLGFMTLIGAVVYMGSQEASASFPEIWGQLTPYFESLQSK